MSSGNDSNLNNFTSHNENRNIIDEEKVPSAEIHTVGVAEETKEATETNLSSNAADKPMISDQQADNGNAQKKCTFGYAKDDYWSWGQANPEADKNIQFKNHNGHELFLEEVSTPTSKREATFDDRMCEKAAAIQRPRQTIRFRRVQFYAQRPHFGRVRHYHGPLLGHTRARINRRQLEMGWIIEEGSPVVTNTSVRTNLRVSTSARQVLRPRLACDNAAQRFAEIASSPLFGALGETPRRYWPLFGVRLPRARVNMPQMEIANSIEEMSDALVNATSSLEDIVRQ